MLVGMAQGVEFATCTVEFVQKQRCIQWAAAGVRLTQVPRSPLRSVDVESLDGEERGGQTSWLARFTRKE